MNPDLYLFAAIWMTGGAFVCGVFAALGARVMNLLWESMSGGEKKQCQP